MPTLYTHPDAAHRPYAAAAVHQGVVYACGQLPRRPDGTTPDDLSEQVVVALDNLAAVLHEAGGDLHHLLKLTVYLADLADFDTYNNAYLTRLEGIPLPPRTTIQVAAFRGATRIEIDAIGAVAPTGSDERSQP
ncbi:RidA family protein [Allosaccharopolyspora coralli]|nr:RidA family protein [Allosaccharopolyspora coralli]